MSIMKIKRLFCAAAIALAAVACTPAAQPASQNEEIPGQAGNDETPGDDNGGNNGGENGGENGGDNGGENPGGDDSGVKPGTYTIDFTAQGYANQEEVKKLEQDGITLEFTNAKWYDNGTSLRLYSSSTMTVTCPKMIEKVTFTFGERDNTNTISADCGTFTSPDWTGESGKIVFAVDGESGHRRVAKLDITVGSAASGQPVGTDPGTNPGTDPGTVTPGEDVLTVAWTEVRSSGTYYKWEGKKGSASSAVYAGDTANFQDKAIQLNSKTQDYGLYTTASGGRVAKVSVVWDTNTYTGSPRVLNVYGNNKAYTSAAELYSASAQGTLLGQITYTKDTQISVSGNYTYVGLCSADGALYLDEIRIVWE